MKIKSKGKVHPSPPLPPFSSSSGDDSLSVLGLLPAAILVLVSVLSPEDREVLAYLITRSLKTTTIAAAASAGVKSVGRRSPDSKKSSNKKRAHKPPLFDCDCFDCYTSYWFRWDSSPNRELVNQIIEAFEDHLTNGENSASKKSNGRGKKKEKSARRVVEPSGRPIAKITEPIEPMVPPSHEVPHEKSPRRLDGGCGAEGAGDEMEKSMEIVRLPVAAATAHKGLARKVLPDVLGLFNSRFWSLWNPNA